MRRALLAPAALRQDPGSTAVEDFYIWSKELADLRDRFEHPHPALEITPVEVEVDEGKLKAVHPPRVTHLARTLRQCLEPMVPAAIDYMERLTALLLGERC